MARLFSVLAVWLARKGIRLARQKRKKHHSRQISGMPAGDVKNVLCRHVCVSGVNACLATRHNHKATWPLN